MYNDKIILLFTENYILKSATFANMAKKKKYYVIWRGHETGIYESWDACRNLIQGYPNALYKSFSDLESAREAFYGNPHEFLGKSMRGKEISKAEKERIGEPIEESLAVDAACSGNPGIMEYRGVIVANHKEIFHKGPYPQGTVNIGEFLALVHGLAWLKQNNYKIPVYSDSITAIKWVKQKKTNTKLEMNDVNRELFNLIKRAESWLTQNNLENKILKWETEAWGEIPADFGRK